MPRAVLSAPPPESCGTVSAVDASATGCVNSAPVISAAESDAVFLQSPITRVAAARSASGSYRHLQFGPLQKGDEMGVGDSSGLR